MYINVFINIFDFNVLFLIYLEKKYYRILILYFNIYI